MRCRSHPFLPLLRRSTWPAVTGAAAATPQSATTPACPTWSSTASTWSSSKACSTCCSPGPTEPTRTPWLCASSVSWTKTETPSSIFGSSSAAWVSRMRFCVCVCVCGCVRAQMCPFANACCASRCSVSRGPHREAEAPLQDACHTWWVRSDALHSSLGNYRIYLSGAAGLLALRWLSAGEKKKKSLWACCLTSPDKSLSED